MLKITGLDAMSKNLNALSAALESLGTMNVEFDPNDPASIDAAVKNIESQVDERVAPWAGTPFVDQIVADTKEKLADMIFRRAAELRREQGADNVE
ncbi:hypothetical protein ACF8OH_04530 [Delftia sp. WSY_9]|uniref:Uncharacterized protein n=1 Tax=Delftia tsuruhatensis TaxID=180282 RepID=A0AAX3STC0_9BURK|nr:MULTISPECIES: hypothetical protein [Delftia]WFF83321.1 hypothetical protein PYR84_11690 [Delftia tsuruhatensis]